MRVRVWPVLLGVNLDDVDANEYDTLTTATHRDSSVVDVDVARSLWAYTPDWSDEAREAKRQELQRLLTATVCSNQDVYYYQGLHDIASVLLFVLGEHLAFVCLRRMVQVHLRDCTRYVAMGAVYHCHAHHGSTPGVLGFHEHPLSVLLYMSPPTSAPQPPATRIAQPPALHRPTMEPVLEQLSLLHAVLRECDDEVYRRLCATELPPVYALPWLITWFAHTGMNIEAMGRMFDLFLASHPLMPLYACAIVMRVGALVPRPMSSTALVSARICCFTCVARTARASVLMTHVHHCMSCTRCCTPP